MQNIGAKKQRPYSIFSGISYFKLERWMLRLEIKIYIKDGLQNNCFITHKVCFSVGMHTLVETFNPELNW